MSISAKLLSKLKVKVFKKEKDDRISLCGEPMQTDEDGREFFVIPAHQADYIKDIFKQYELSEEFIPAEQNTIAPAPARQQSAASDSDTSDSLLSGEGLNMSSYMRAKGLDPRNTGNRTAIQAEYDAMIEAYGDRIEKHGNDYFWRE